MQRDPIIVTLAYPDGAAASFEGHGAIIYTSAPGDRRTFAVSGILTLGDLAQLMNELIDSFGFIDLMLALSIAHLSAHMNPEEDAGRTD